MDAGVADKKSIRKNIPPKRHSFLWVNSLADGLALILLTFLPSLSLNLSADTNPPQQGPLAPSSHNYELQDIHAERIHFASNPPSHPLTFKVDHQQKLWVVDQLKPAINRVRSTITSGQASPQKRFQIVIYEDLDGKEGYETSRIFIEWTEKHSDLLKPVIFVDEGLVYLGTASGLSLIYDIDQDGKADLKRDLISEAEYVNGHSPLNVTAITKGPFGWIFFTSLDHDLGHLELSPSDSGYPTSAIFKCRPDGSSIQKIATGLNHPEDLIFDAYGNLFTSDKGKEITGKPRCIYVSQGADYGYRKPNHQEPNVSALLTYRSEALPQGMDMQRPFQHIENLPPSRSKQSSTQRFIACGSGRSSKEIYAFSLTLKNGSFQLTNLNQWNLNLSPNEMTLSPDGKLYMTQLINAQDSNQNPGIYKIILPSVRHLPSSIHTASILRADLSKKTTARLIHLFQHHDQRVRTKAQTALVKRGSTTLKALTQAAKDPYNAMSRLHAIWAVGQLSECDREIAGRNDIQAWLNDLMKDPSSEIRAQAAVLAGRIGDASIHRMLVERMKDPSQRVRQMSLTAAGKLKLNGVLETIIEFLTAPDNHHPLLQQAAFVAMADACSEDALSTLAAHHDSKVRRSGNLALRRQKSNQTARFINDDSSDIMIEAAQSIHNTPIQNALPQLARLHENRKVWIKKFESETEDTESLSAYAIEMLYYVYHANFILGKAGHLRTIVSAAGDQALPGSIRRMCLQWVRSWMSNKTTEDSPDETQNRSASKTVLKQAAEEWLRSTDTGQQAIMLGYLETFGWNEFKPAVASLFRTFNAKPETRASALKLLFHWEPEHIAPYLNEALISNSAFLRKEAVLVQARMDPTDAVAHCTERLEFGEMKERQEALKELGSLLDRRVDAVLLHWLERALQDKLPSGLSQHLQQAAAQRTAPAVKRSLKQWQTANQISPEKQ